MNAARPPPPLKPDRGRAPWETAEAPGPEVEIEEWEAVALVLRPAEVELREVARMCLLDALAELVLAATVRPTTTGLVALAHASSSFLS
jgi:hypothetical protein